MKGLLKKIMQKQDLSEMEVSQIFEGIINGSVSPILAGGILTALAMKGETEEEILGIVKTMRRHMRVLDFNENLLDTCGTGGDGLNTINVSTISAFVCASAGVRVAKHGNRSVSSKCGSFDVLEKLGVKIDITANKAKECLDKINIACLFAPLYHPAMKQIASVRKELGIRTVFNYIGPLLNPAGATHQLIGVSSPSMAENLGKILMKLGSKRVVLVHSDDGLDEVSIASPTQIYEFMVGRKMQEYKIVPDKIYCLDEVRGGEIEENAEIMKNILNGRGTKAQNEFVEINSALALYVAGKVETIAKGKNISQQILNSGLVGKKLAELVVYSNIV